MTLIKVDCKHCLGTGLGSLSYGSDSKCWHCNGKGYTHVKN